MTQDQIVGENIKLFREKLGLTQENLASYLGKTREEVSYYETGKRAIPTEVITKSAQLFGIDDYDLFENDKATSMANVSFAFRAATIDEQDLHHIADFRKIVLNYLRMKKEVAS